MADKNLSTDPYKGVRDFYPEDMAIQNYIFSVWKKVAEEFKYQEYSASLLEYAELYRSKGSDEIVNEQMYIFTDKGDREVALRPEMTPTLARMVAAKRKSWKFPLRWFSIPNCFRYERPQRGRKREHWQLNCDIMGIAGIEAEVEIISLAHKIMKEFGAKDEDFEIRLGSRVWLNFLTLELGDAISSEEKKKKLYRLIDIKEKDKEKYLAGLKELDIPPSELEFDTVSDEFLEKIGVKNLLDELAKKGIKNIHFDKSIVRGFDYYTGMVFEVFDTNPENRRALFGGGRYDNLLEMFGVDPVPTVGFGMGDVTMRDFLETHKLPLTR
ncbi:MAG: ATP phosphoribosyltransferase regulatory subunit [Candidatus Pacebacteria bacterium]|nr:ATP phosphoribosyltransferase regulatory subunit [Candidatus Paceibacterota bacterium]